MGRVPVRPDLLLSKRAEVQSEPSFNLGPAASSVALKRWLKEGTVRPRLCFLICLSRLPLQGGEDRDQNCTFSALPSRRQSCRRPSPTGTLPVRPALPPCFAEGRRGRCIFRALEKVAERRYGPTTTVSSLSVFHDCFCRGGGPRPGLHLFCLAIKKAERQKAQSDQDSPSPTGHSPLLSRRQRGRSDRDQSQPGRPFPLALKRAEGSARP